MPNAGDVPEIADSAICSVRGVSRSFGDVKAVDDVTLEVPRGTILGVIGPSGSGKTTLIRLLTGTLIPSSGELRVLGQEPRRFSRHTRERIGYMPQHFVLYEELTAAENVSFVAALFGLLWPKRGRRVREVLQLVELWEARGRRARQLSGGMQRRLELACALVHQPNLLFVDEPTAGQDPMLRQTIWNEFRRLRDVGRTLVVTTHEVIEIETSEPFDGRLLERVPGVRRVDQSAPRHMLLITDDAGAATPRVLQEINTAGGQVVSSSEYVPSFDDVFGKLVSRDDDSSYEEEGRPSRGRGVPRAA